MAPAMTRALSVRHIGWKLAATGVALCAVGWLLLPSADRHICAWVTVTGGDD
jgi:hypothetical protein